MATFFYQSNANSTKQAWLGSVLLCNSCNSQKPKQQFRMYDGESVCAECWLDNLDKDQEVTNS